MLREVYGNIWDWHDKGCWIVVPTNGFVKSNGRDVMGRGLAKQAAERFKDLSWDLGQAIIANHNENIVFAFPQYRIFSFPVKFNWWEEANLGLIEHSSLALSRVVSDHVPNADVNGIYLPRVGCGNGKLRWENVKPILERYLDDRFVICDLA